MKVKGPRIVLAFLEDSRMWVSRDGNRVVGGSLSVIHLDKNAIYRHTS